MTESISCEHTNFQSETQITLQMMFLNVYHLQQIFAYTRKTSIWQGEQITKVRLLILYIFFKYITIFFCWNT